MPAAKTRVDRLIIDRDRLEAAITKAAPSLLPKLVNEHRAVLAEIDKLAEPKKGSVRDQLAAKRATREAGAKGAAAAPVRQRGRRTGRG